MSNALENFLANTDSSNTNEDEVRKETGLQNTEPVVSGTMLITGCVDFAKPIGSKGN
jgi:hypothetical protein